MSADQDNPSTPDTTDLSGSGEGARRGESSERAREDAQPEAPGKEAEGAAPADPCKPKPGESPDQALARLRECLKIRQHEQEAAETEATHAQAQISAIEQTVKDLDQIIEEYKKVQPELKAKREDYSDYRTHETNCLESILKAATKEVRDRVAALRKEISDLRADLPGYEEQVAVSRGEVQRLSVERDARKAELEARKAILGAINAAHSQLDTLKGKVSEAYDAGLFALAYWWLTDPEKGFGGVLDSADWPQKAGSWAKPIPWGEFAEKLHAALTAYLNAIDSVQRAEDKLGASQQALDGLKSHIADLESTLETRIIDALKKIKPHEAAAA